MNKISFFLFFIFFLQNFTYSQNNWGEEEIYYAPKFIIQPPMKNETIRFQNYSVSAQNSKTLNHPSGTKIIVPANAFVNANGKIVEGKVDIKFREFNNPLDIYFSGIPMTVERAGKKEFFQSAGMVELRASQDGQEVFPNPNGEMIAIELTSDQLDDDFQMYNLDEASGEWIENGKDEVLWDSKKLMTKGNNQNTGDNFIRGLQASWIPPPVSPFIGTAYVDFDLDKYDYKRGRKKRKRLLRFEIKCSTYTSNNKDSKHIIKSFPELKEVKNIEWIYNGKNKKEVKDFLAKTYVNNNPLSQKRIKGKYELKDIIITPNFENDNYTIEIKCEGIQKTIEAYPFLSTYSETIDQKKNQRFYKKYKKKYLKRCEEWKKLEDSHMKVMKDYEVSLTEYQKEIIQRQQMMMDKNVLDLLSQKQVSNGVTRRRMDVYTFGILNIDKLMPLLDKQLLVELNLQDQSLVNYLKVVVFDQTNNAMLSFYPDEKIRFDKNATNSLLVILENSTGAIICAEDFADAFEKRKRRRLSFTITPLEKEKFNKKIISDALASN